MNTSLGAIYVLWLRQLKRYLRSRARIIGSLGQPLLFLTALGFGLGPIYQKAGAGDYLQFLSPGVIAMSILFTAMFSGIEMLWDRQFGFLKEMLVAPVPRLAIMIGRTLGGSTVAVIQGVVVLVITMIFGFHPPSVTATVLALVFMFLIAALFAALGTVIASTLNDMQGFQLIMNFLIMPLFFFSGALFPLDNLPPVLATIVRLNPMAYGVDGLRGVLLGMSHFGVGYDFGILLGVTAVFLVIGSYLFSKIEA
jgi:ABC-2 type transport system permease protein